MSSRLKQRFPIGGSQGGRFIKWNDTREGTIFEGRFLGLRESAKYANALIADLDTDDGPLALPCPTVLARKLSQVRVGADAAVEYLGRMEGRDGKSYHDFNVFTGSPEDQLSAKKSPTTRAAAPSPRVAVTASAATADVVDHDATVPF